MTRAGNTGTVERKIIGGGKIAAAIGVMEAIKADITAMAATAESPGLKQFVFSVRERVFTGRGIVTTAMTVV